MAMIKRCAAKVKRIVSPEKEPELFKKMAQKVDVNGTEICDINDRFMYIAVSGLHGSEMDRDANSPGFGQKKGNCLHPDTPVLMAEGYYKKISEIKVGDLVVGGGSGKIRKITNVWQKPFDGQIKVLHVQGQHLPLKLTDAHVVPLVEKDRWNKCSVKYRYPSTASVIDHVKFLLETEPVLTDAVNIQSGDKGVRTSFNFEHITDEINDYDVAWALGLYAAEGCTYNDDVGLYKGIILVLNKNEVDLANKFGEVIQKLWPNRKLVMRYPKGHPNMRCECYGGEIAEFFKKYIQGKRTSSKYLSSEIMKMPPKWQLHFLAGLFDGDGCNSIDKYGRDIVRCVSVSEQLFMQVRLILDRNKIGSTFSVQKNRGSFGDRSGGKILWLHEICVSAGQVNKLVKGLRVRANVNEEDMFSVETIYFGDNNSFVNLSKISYEYYNGMVYDIEVDVDHKFLSHIDLHNSNGDYMGWEDTLLVYRPKFGMRAYETWRGRDCLVNHDETQVIGDLPDVFPLIPEKSIDMMMRIDKNRAWTICESVRKGSITDVSMGLITEYSLCSVCDNRATDESHWCRHCKSCKGQYLQPDELESNLRDKWPHGVWACEINKDICGLECSIISIGMGADENAKIRTVLYGADKPIGKQFSRNASILNRWATQYEIKKYHY